MSGKKITREKIIESLLSSAFDKSTGGTSLADIAGTLNIKKASLYNHFENRTEIISATLAYSRQYMSKVTFTPPDTDSIAAKYSADTVLKGVVNRYFKIYEREPLFQIYIFLQSEKYFTYEALEILNSEKEKMIAGTIKILQSLSAADKIRAIAFGPAAVWFCNAVLQMLDSYLAERKETIRQNPESGAGSLFALPSDDRTIAQVNTLIEKYIQALESTPAPHESPTPPHE
jgi:AcrR family transcriptional regulator